MKNAIPYIVLIAGAAAILTGAALSQPLIMAAPAIVVSFAHILKA